jgi:hypothetical protein
MPTKPPSNQVFIVIAVIALFVAFFGIGPFLWAAFDKYYNMVNVRSHQNPEELRTWATNLIAIYSASNNVDVIPGRIPNRPPSGIPTSDRYPEVLIQRDQMSGHYHVALLWGIGISSWGMDIGDTNFVIGGDRTIEWKPGIYFLR